MSPTQRVLLRNTSQRKWLTREPSHQDVMVRNDVKRNRPDIPCDVCFRLVMVGCVGDTGEFVPLASKDALSADIFESSSDATNAGEEVDEGEFWNCHT